MRTVSYPAVGPSGARATAPAAHLRSRCPIRRAASGRRRREASRTPPFVRGRRFRPTASCPSLDTQTGRRGLMGPSWNKARARPAAFADEWRDTAKPSRYRTFGYRTFGDTIVHRRGCRDRSKSDKLSRSTPPAAGGSGHGDRRYPIRLRPRAAREAAALHRSTGRLPCSRPTVRAHAAAGGRRGRHALLSGPRGAGPRPDRSGGARSVRQGAGDTGGHLGPRLLADRRGADSTGRRRVGGHVRGHSRSGGEGSRLPERTARRAALQAARLRAGRVLLRAPRHRESRWHDRDPLALAAGRGGRRRAGRSPPRPRGRHRHGRRGAVRAGVRGVLCRLHARGPARSRRPPPVTGVQPVSASR